MPDKTDVQLKTPFDQESVDRMIQEVEKHVQESRKLELEKLARLGESELKYVRRLTELRKSGPPKTLSASDYPPHVLFSGPTARALPGEGAPVRPVVRTHVYPPYALTYPTEPGEIYDSEGDLVGYHGAFKGDGHLSLMVKILPNKTTANEQFGYSFRLLTASLYAYTPAPVPFLSAMPVRGGAHFDLDGEIYMDSMLGITPPLGVGYANCRLWVGIMNATRGTSVTASLALPCRSVGFLPNSDDNLGLHPYAWTGDLITEELGAHSGDNLFISAMADVLVGASREPIGGIIVLNNFSDRLPFPYSPRRISVPSMWVEYQRP